MGMIFTDQFKIHGAVMSYSESLLYSGYSQLNLTRIFMASIFIGASGAVMDLAVDITSSVSEVVEKKPDITAREAIKSGFTRGPRRAEHPDHHAAAGLFRRLHRAG